MKTLFSILLTLACSTLLPRFAFAQSSCENLFGDSPTRLHAAKFKRFVFEDSPLQDRVRSLPAKFMFMARVRKYLPAGIYEARLDGEPDRLYVSYQPNGDAVIRLASRPLFQSEPVPLTTSGAPNSPGRTLVENMSYGIDSGIQLKNDHLVLTNSTIRGNEKTLSGLNRNDTGLELDVNNGLVETLFITDRTENWSIHRVTNGVIERRTRIEIVR